MTDLTDSSDTGASKPLWQRPRFVVAAAAGLAFVIFALQNRGEASVDFLFWSFDFPLVLLMILCFAAGVVVWEAFKYFRRRGRPVPPDGSASI